jgi:hypothetical protein
MVKTDWQMDDTVMPDDLNQIGQELNDKPDIHLAIDPPLAPTTRTFWYHDMGESPDLGGGGGLLIGNAALNDSQDVWFEELN